MSKEFVKEKRVDLNPRLPLEGFIDLTYRCNNNCRHCWVRIPQNSLKLRDELSLEAIKDIIDQAKSMGCRTWTISGGEPMLRDDFEDIFRYITENSIYYSINTNGTRITPSIARAMRKKGNKWVAIYGADSKIHDHITRSPGSFSEAMQGMAYLKEAGANFTVQIVPMRDNFVQLQEMIKLAESLGYQWRVNKAWFCYSASGDPKKNKEIREQRLPASELYTIDDVDFPEGKTENRGYSDSDDQNEDGLLSCCIRSRRDFHIDAYGWMSFCNFIKDPALRYDLKRGTFYEAWEHFIPSLSDKVRNSPEYKKNCGSCDLKAYCEWCPVYSYLETGRYDTKIDSLCNGAAEKKRLMLYKQKRFQRFYQIAGITVQVQSDLPIAEDTFGEKFKSFEINQPGEEKILIRHHFSIPDLNQRDLGEEIYFKPPIAVYQKKDAWIYLTDVSEDKDHRSPGKIAIVDRKHTRIRIFHHSRSVFQLKNFQTLTLFPTDIILLGWTLAHKGGCWIHSSGVVMDQEGILFIGPSGSGKSTMVKLLGEHAKLLCDDRNIVRLWDDGFKVHGTWAHGELPTVNPDSAPLKKIFFLNKSNENRIIPLEDKMESYRKIIQCLIRPVQTNEWWNKMFNLIELLQKTIPMYIINFSMDGKIVEKLKSM